MHSLAVLVLINRASSTGCCPLTLSQLTAAAVLTVHKFYSDRFFTNLVVANHLLMPCALLNLVELEFLKALNFEIIVTSDQLEDARKQLEDLLRTMVGISTGIGTPITGSTLDQ